MVPAPDRTLVQRLDALDKANRIRRRRAELKLALAQSDANFRELVREPPEWLESCRVRTMLLALPGLGAAKVRTIMARAGIADSKTFGGLTGRQRVDLVLILDRYPSTRHALDLAAARTQETNA